MTLFSTFYQQISTNQLLPWLNHLPSQLSAWEQQAMKGQFNGLLKNIAHLPTTDTNDIELTEQVRIGTAADLPPGLQKQTRNLLMKMKPWRKGPFFIHGVHVDTEWRSDWKWERLRQHISPLAGRHVLDVGCGSGYHLWRMRGDGAEFVVGIDPCDLFFAQFLTIQHYVNEPAVQFLPLGIDALPAEPLFDTVFSMGVLYHRRSPIDFLFQLKNQLVQGGELVLETLVIEGDENDVLVPGDRYAKMPNVWFIPSIAALSHWLARVGFSNIKLIALDKTSFAEQRKTEWLDSESLDTFLDVDDPTKTVEGYPAPLRATITARRD